jgi:hypothetical protein
VDSTTLRDDELRESSPKTRQADETDRLTHVVPALRTGVAMPTDDVRLDDNSITDVDVIDTATHFVDYPGELVTERDRHRLAGERVRSVCSRSKDRPLEVLVQVGPADAAPLDLDFDRPGRVLGSGMSSMRMSPGS